jgi:O-antigen/teichoic acid export membrane protein
MTPTVNDVTVTDPRVAHGRFTGAVATLGGGRIAGALLSAAWLVVAARHLSVNAFGDLSVLLSIGAILTVVSDLGYPFLLSHAVAAAGMVSRRTLAHVVRRRLIAGLATASITAVLYLAVAGSNELAVPILFAVSMLATVVYSSITGALRGLGVYRAEALNETLSRGFVLAAGTLWLSAGGGLTAAVAVYAIADVVSLVTLVALTRRRVVDGEDGIDLDEFSFRRTAHLTTGRVLATIYYRADSWLMALMRGSAAAGLYAAPYRLLDGLLLLPRAVGAVVVSRGSRDRGSVSTPRFVGTTVLAASIVALPIIVFATPIVTFLFGNRYASAGPVLAVLAASSVPGAVAMAALPLVGIRFGRHLAHMMAIALAANIGLNLVVIPRFGPIGAASTTLACQLVLVVALVPAFVRARPSEPESTIAKL